MESHHALISLILEHDLVRKVCNFSGSCSVEIESNREVLFRLVAGRSPGQAAPGIAGLSKPTYACGKQGALDTARFGHCKGAHDGSKDRILGMPRINSPPSSTTLSRGRAQPMRSTRACRLVPSATGRRHAR
jgi:hypothetical protein